MKTGMKSFVLVSIILAFFIFNLTGCKGKKEEETQISQQAAKAAEVAEEPAAEIKEEAKQEEKEKIEEGLPFLKGVEEVDVPKFIWGLRLPRDWISRAYIVDKERERELIEESDTLSQILSEESSSPFFLLKGREKQYLVDIKGNIRKEILYPSSDLVISFDKKTNKVIGKTRDGEVQWEREWEPNYEKAMISPDKNWAILFPTPDAGYGFAEGEHIVAIDRNSKESWRLDYTDRAGGLTGFPMFSDNGKKLAFGIDNTLYYASKEKILWNKKFHRIGVWPFLKISPSGDLLLCPILNFYVVNNKGITLWEVPEGFVTRKDGYSINEKFLTILGERKAPGRNPFFIIVVDVQKGKIIKSTKYWIRSESPLYRGILNYNSYIKIFENKYLMLCVPNGANFDVYLYEISHILKQ